MSVEEDRLDGRPEDALVGTLFAGCYEIVSVLGRGGMSVVYKALYIPLNQLVAVKVMHTHVDEGAALQRLKREAQLISTLDHPNILRVLRLQLSDDGYPYLVADLIEGRTIQKVVQEDGTFDEATFKHVFTQVLDALEHAHSRSIVHRDIKPSNLMITQQEDGEMRVKVVDFGISKLLTDSAGGAQDVSRATSSFFGTPAYMSPEQCAGRSADYRSDIYSLACVMYETLTGVPAVSGETALDIMYHQVHDMPRPFSAVRPDLKLSPHIEQAIFTALRKNRSDRPQSIHEFRTMLSGQMPVERLIQHGRIRRLSRWAVVVVGLVALMMAIVLGVPFTMLMSNEAMSHKEEATPAPVVPSLPSTAEECYNEGMRAQIRRDNDLVIRCLQRADELVKVEKHSRLTPQHQYEVKMFLALAYRTRRDVAMADKYYAQAQALLKNTDVAGAGWYWRERSDFEGEKKQFPKAVEYAKKSVAACDKAFRAGPFERAYTDLANAYRRLGEAYQANGQIKESDDAWRKAVEVSDPMDWAGPKLENRRLWSMAMLSEGRFDDAKKEMDDYMKIAQTTSKVNLKSEDELMLGYQMYGLVIAKTVSPQAARPYLARSVELARARSMSSSESFFSRLAECLSAEAANLFECGQIADAERVAKEAKDCWTKVNIPENARAGIAAIDIARERALKRAAAPTH